MTITSIGDALEYPDELRTRVQATTERVVALRTSIEVVLAEAAEVLREEDELDSAVAEGLAQLGLDAEQLEAVHNARYALSPAMGLLQVLADIENGIRDTIELATDAEESEFGPGPDPVENGLRRLDELNEKRCGAK